MIPRHYFYLIEAQEQDSKYCWGVLTAKSWFANPQAVSRKVIADFCEKTGRSESVCKVVRFNRI